jgi:hypothetical protein
MTRCTLSFSVKLATSDADLHDACVVRAQGYGHHLPHAREQFSRPDAQDRHRATAVVLCHDKQTGNPIGTLRIQRNCSGPLQLESSLILPRWLAEQSKAEITRLAVARGADPLTRLMLMKASYLYCLAAQVRWMVIGARCDSGTCWARTTGCRCSTPAGCRTASSPST